MGYRFILALLLIGSMFVLDSFYPQPDNDCQEIMVLAPPDMPIVYEQDLPTYEVENLEVVNDFYDQDRRLTNLSLESIKDWQNVATVPPDKIP